MNDECQLAPPPLRVASIPFQQRLVITTAMTRILLPTDLSDGSLVAAAFAVDAFGIDDVHYLLLHAYLQPGLTDPAIPYFSPEIEQIAVDGLRTFEERVRALRPGASLEVSGAVVMGGLMPAINDACAEQGIDAVVMGTRGKGNALLIGSAASLVVKRCSRPVIVVPPEWKPAPIERILYADDRMWVDGKGAVAMLVRLAKRYGAEITLMYVREGSDAPLPVSELAAEKDRFEGTKYSVIAVAGDDAISTILNASDRGRFGMVAVLHRDLGLLDRIFHQSVAKRLALHTKVPLLVVQER